ncbi:pol [Symbiodinium natans]|uniref:Pol protein n=1 Tax=Symbiodinium natans TaxID=878477 RepID=A0A812NG73_9DINO|nr:pol [Symbiodinium natans]
MRAALGLGRMDALRKPTGGTRGLVIGDFLRRLIARTLAQQFAPSLEEACRPHQYALGNRAGLDALVDHVQARCALDPTLTVVSLDASAAFDGISRQAILHELRHLPEAAALLPFARLWLGRPSSFVWQQGSTTRRITQAEGVEQGDPLSTALFCLGLRPALRDLQREIREDLGERIVAYLDDVTILASPQRALHLVQRFESLLARHMQLRLNLAKTALWNEASPPLVSRLAA